jgi:murein DD-endopeptidase MepM/ murein hydrolase activator NlpD
MNIRNGVFHLFLWLMLLLTVYPPGLAAEEKVHIVQRDETIYSIARIFGISRDELMKYNGITDPTKLRAGQQLRIPDHSVPVPPKTGDPAPVSVEYRVVRNDTFYGIARRFSISLDALLEANALTKEALLREGAVLKIPSAPSSSGTETREKPEAPAAPSPGQEKLPGDSRLGGFDPRETVTKTVDPSIRWPVSAREVSYMTGKLRGVVLAGEKAESVKSLTQGTVVSAGPYRGFGRVAIVQAAGGYLYVYGGCESLSVKEGDRVNPGTELGKLGIDAVSLKPQLFFLVYRNNAPVDPAKAPRT